MKFPNVIHVVQDTAGDDSYLVVEMDGVLGLEDDKEPVAIYKLVGVGHVSVAKKFVGKAAK